MRDEHITSVPDKRDIDVESSTSSKDSRGRSSSRSSSISLCSRRSGSRRSNRGRLEGTGNERFINSGKNCAAHVPVFPRFKDPTNIVLEPFPNRRVRSMCIAGGALVTVHRNGIRVYRQRYITSTQVEHVKNDNINHSKNKNIISSDIPEVRTGLWEAVEFRDNFQFRDAYLCVGAESVFYQGRILPLKWNRYLAVACGADRTHFSVCVVSTAAHFVLHHNLHEKNKVVALNFALVAMETRPNTRRYQPFVVSVDEIGEVVIFDVEHDRAVKVVTTPVALGTPTTETFTDDNSTTGSPHPLTDDNNNNNNNENRDGDNDNAAFVSVKNNITDTPTLGSPVTVGGNFSGESRVYRLDAGLASNVCLVGPCQVYCRRCSDDPVVPGSLMMSLYISSRSHGADGQAELHVLQLRFRWIFFPPQAVVISETLIVRESAPEDVCDIGIGMLRVPFNEGSPQIFMIGRPRLRFWTMSGCTGRLLHLHRVYNDTDGSGKGARTLKEYFLRVVPLGRHVLVQDVTTSWLCIAALTDDDVVLLLGKEPRPACSNTPTDASKKQTSSVIMTPEVLEKETLEAWLDEVEGQKKKPHLEMGQQQEEQGADENSPSDGVPLLVTPPLTCMDPNQDYTVLMVLTAPGAFSVPPSLTQKKPFYPSRILISLPQSNELLFFMGVSDEIYSIKLPFVWPVVSDEATHKELTAQKPWGNLASPSNGWMDAAFSASFLRDLQIARPLISAVWGLAGEVELDETALPFWKSHLQQQQQQLQDEEEEQSPSMTTEGGVMNEKTRTACTVVPVHIDSDNGQAVRRKKRRCSVSSIMSVDDRSEDNDYNNDDADMRRAYVAAERHKILTTNYQHSVREDEWREFYVESVELFAQIITRDEPLQRNAIMYEWSDIHDNFYVQFIQEGHDILEKENRCDMEHGPSLPEWASQESLRECFALSNFNECVHSAGFMQVFRNAQQKRQEFCDKGGVFDFASYFASGVVPQRLLDLQEDDRCRFELEDLKVAFEDDMKKFQEVETIVVYENEERRVDRNGRRRWMPHQTFHFDDENGNVVDIAALNLTVSLPKATVRTPVAATAGMMISSVPGGWRWANDTTDGRVLRSGGSKMLRKELQFWHIGEWMYAERWPNREEELQGTFQWSTTAGVNVANVRRRRLSRNRVNVAIEAAKEARHQEYMKSLEQLRMELGL